MADSGATRRGRGSPLLQAKNPENRPSTDVLERHIHEVAGWIHRDRVRMSRRVAREGRQRIALDLERRDRAGLGRDEEATPLGIHREDVGRLSNGVRVHHSLRAQIEHPYPAILLPCHIDEPTGRVHMETVRTLNPRDGNAVYD